MKKIYVLIVIILCINGEYKAQSSKKDGEIYRFSIVKQIPHSPIKNQQKTGTCWSFATISFLESEIIRKTGNIVDLSEMYIVRHAYSLKARYYLETSGKNTFGEGGISHDVTRILKEYGIVPDSIYPGLTNNTSIFNHNEMEGVIKGIANAVLNTSTNNDNWNKVYEYALDTYMGETPKTFVKDSKVYSPISYTNQYLKINPDDYVEITSYTHLPNYSYSELELPDNWTHDKMYNVPLDELIMVIDSALIKGYTLTWDGDVSENEFLHEKAIAILPVKKWESKDITDKSKTGVIPENEEKVTPLMRQNSFEDKTTTEDHLMHIVGFAKDQKGNKFYYVKNSWGCNSGEQGYMYISEAYCRMKLVDVMVNKNALPLQLRKKLGI